MISILSPLTTACSHFLALNKEKLSYKQRKHCLLNNNRLLLLLLFMLLERNTILTPGPSCSIEGRLALNPGLNLTRVSFSSVQKHFPR